MAVDAPILYNGCWCYLRDSMGPRYGTPNERQTTNAKLFYNILRVFGYSLSAAAGILGNMQTESGLSPAAIEGGTASVLPNNGEHFSDLTNSAMLVYGDQYNNGYGTGLVQWDKWSTNAPVGNLIASFATRYNHIWYDWELQLFRLETEYIYDPSGWGGVNGTTMTNWISGNHNPSTTWENFKSHSGTPEDAADIFRECYERSSGDPDGNQHRRDNARYWYNYFTSTTVTTQVSFKMNADMAYLFRDSQYPYSRYDCISFVNLVRRRLGIPVMTNGTNSLWRNVGGNFLYWRGTLQECLNEYGSIPEGAYLFKCYPEGTPGYNTIPEQYRGDGVGNFDHIGIYTNLGLGVMQSGGYDVTPPSGFNGVHDTRTRLDETPPWWTHVAFGNNIADTQYPPYQFPVPLLLQMFGVNKRKVLKNVKRCF